MKISWNHLSQLVDLKNINVKDAADQLTLAGFEVESIKRSENIEDTILTIDITANRQDVTGWAQIAIELSAILKRPLTRSNLKPMKALRFLNALNFIQEREVHACIANTDIRFDLTNNQLKAFGISNGCKLLDIVDFANLKWGQAIKAYIMPSEAKVKIQDLRICEINSREKNVRNKLKIYAGDKELVPIKKEHADCASGILKVAFISCQNQNSIQEQLSKSAGNKHYCLNAYSEILSMLKTKAIDKEEDWIVYSHHSSKHSSKSIMLKEEDIHRVLGPSKMKSNNRSLSLNKIVEIIKNLQLEAEYTEDNIRVIVPSERFDDIKSKIDIVEEVARIYGFNNFYDTVPKFSIWNQSSKSTRIQQRIRNILRSMGLHEVINYSLRSSRVQKSSNPSIINPLSQEQEVLRGSIINGILESLEYNIKQGNSNFEVFEIGNVFIKNTHTKKYQESLHLGFLLGNGDFNKLNWQRGGESLTWLQAKGHAEELFERIHAQVSWHEKGSKSVFSKDLQKYTHPKNHIHIFSNTKAIGILSEVRHITEKSNRSKTYFLEINVEELVEAIQNTEQLQYTYRQYSSYPKITRDFSIKTSAITPMEKIQQAIAEMLRQEERIESVVIANEYYGNRDEKTICLRATYRSKSKTLAKQEVEILDKIFKERMAVF